MLENRCGRPYPAHHQLTVPWWDCFYSVSTVRSGKAIQTKIGSSLLTEWKKAKGSKIVSPLVHNYTDTISPDQYCTLHTHTCMQ